MAQTHALTVKVVVAGVASHDHVEVSDSATYNDAFRTANLEVPEGYVVTARGKRVDPKTRIAKNTTLILAAPATVSGG